MTALRHALEMRLAEARLAMMMLTRFPVGRLSDPSPSAAATCWAFPLAMGKDHSVGRRESA